MVSDLEEQGLYPPDVEELTPAVRDHRNRVAAGTALVVWGLSLLVQRALGVDLDTLWLGLGLAALAGWTQAPRYSWFVAGSIVTGLGVGELLSGPLDNAFGASLSLLLIGAGFVAIYVRYPRRSSWAIAVAGVFALLAVGSFGIALIGLVPATLGRFLLPLLLIGGGGLLLLRHSLPPKAVRAGLAALAVSFVLVGATSVPDIDPDPIDLDHIGPNFTPQPLELSAGDTLEMVSDGSGNIELRAGDEAAIEVQGPRRRGHGLDIENRPDGVFIGSNHFMSNDDSIDYIVTLPPGVEIELQRGSGSITGEIEGIAGTIRTDSGDIDLRVVDGTDDDLDLESATGRVTLRSDVPIDVDAESDSGTVEVDGRRDEDRDVELDAEVDDALSVEIRTEQGDIAIRRAAAASTPESTTPPTPTAPPAPTTPPAPTVPATVEG